MSKLYFAKERLQLTSEMLLRIRLPQRYWNITATDEDKVLLRSILELCKGRKRFISDYWHLIMSKDRDKLLRYAVVLTKEVARWGLDVLWVSMMQMLLALNDKRYDIYDDNFGLVEKFIHSDFIALDVPLLSFSDPTYSSLWSSLFLLVRDRFENGKCNLIFYETDDEDVSINYVATVLGLPLRQCCYINFDKKILGKVTSSLVGGDEQEHKITTFRELFGNNLPTQSPKK